MLVIIPILALLEVHFVSPYLVSISCSRGVPNDYYCGPQIMWSAYLSHLSAGALRSVGLDH
jgi:hypothetical protein